MLRLAKLARIANTCQMLEVPSTTLPYGAGALAAVAFSASEGVFGINEIAGYVLSGRFKANLGHLIDQQRSIVSAVIRFRDSSEGGRLRKEVLNYLATNPGSDLVAAINGALTTFIPPDVLERSRQSLGLWLPETMKHQPIPALWHELANTTDQLRSWREESRRQFTALCATQRITLYDTCPCGSGEKVRFCCDEALQHKVA